MSDLDRLPYVEAELNYLGRTAERPRYYAYEPSPADPPSVSGRAPPAAPRRAPAPRTLRAREDERG